MKNDIVTLKCVDITVDFYGVCKHEGLVVFVKGMIPDEVAGVKIINIKNRIAFGIIDKLITPSKYRIKEMCPIAYKCGGCDLQHIDYNYQLILKKRLIENIFRNAKLDVDVKDVVSSKDILAYRNKIQVPVSNNKIGYYRNHSNDIVEFNNCFISSELTNSVLNDIKKYIFSNNISNNVRHVVIREASSGLMVCLVVNDINNIDNDNFVNYLLSKYNSIKSIMLNVNNKDTNVIFGDEDIVIYGEDYIVDKCNDISFAIPLRSFYQVNSSQMSVLYDLAIENGELNSNDCVLDLFCGIGSISIYISKFVHRVLGIEIVDKSIEYAKKNKELNNISNVDFVLSDANKVNDFIKDYNTIIVDPPRKGINKELINSIVENSIDKVIYISCNQSTLARDLNFLKEYYDIVSCQPVDMFPQTKHIESVTVLKRK